MNEYLIHSFDIRMVELLNAQNCKHNATPGTVRYPCLHKEPELKWYHLEHLCLHTP